MVNSPVRPVARTLPPQARTIIAGFGVSYLGTGLIMPVNVIYLSDVAHLAAPVVAAFYLLLPAFGLLGESSVADWWTRSGRDRSGRWASRFRDSAG
ncbi:hypothetical protein GCM10029963_24510 [Micromonospora andamanensis]